MRWTVVTNCDSFFITKCDTVYYKLRQVLQSAMDLLQIATGITKCDDYYKLRQYKAPSVTFGKCLHLVLSDLVLSDLVQHLEQRTFFFSTQVFDSIKWAEENLSWQISLRFLCSSY